MRRGEVYWAALPEGLGRRPVVVLTRTTAIPVLTKIVVAPITRTVRGIPTEVPVGDQEGLREDSVINLDDINTVLKRWLDPDPVGALGPVATRRLDAALKYTLEILT